MIYKKTALCTLTLLYFCSSIHARKKTRCTLAHELYYKYKVTKSIIPSVLCLVDNLSEFQTELIKESEDDESKGYGIFQINDKDWCSKDGQGVCKIPCDKLADDRLEDDVRCWRKIHAKHGFAYWKEWEENCKGKYLMHYLQGCPLV